MSVSKMRFIPRRWLIQSGLLSLALIGLALVCHDSYLSIRHDMALITTKQPNVFEMFYQRARILVPEQLAHYIDHSPIRVPIFSDNHDALAYAYGYDLKTRERFAELPLMSSTQALLGTYLYLLSYPEVINLYALFDDHRLLGMMSDNRVLSARMLSDKTGLDDIDAWSHYFGCAAFASTHVPCSNDEAQVSDIRRETFTRRQTITMYFPFDFYDPRSSTYRHGLTGIDIAVDTAFKAVLKPYESFNPTRSVISFNAVEPCHSGHLCLSTPLIRTKAGGTLYLKWSYSYGDFLWKVVLYSSAFKLYLIGLLLLMLSWRPLSLRLRTLVHTDQLTGLPRRDMLDQTMLLDHDYLMILDIDNFKSINDIHGHGVGDIALAAFARHLRGNMRKGDTAIRWGGEEFVAVYRGLDDEDAMWQMVTRLLAQPIKIDELPAPLTFSAGIIRIRDYLSVTEAVTLADELLYHVKQHGKHNIAYYHRQKIRLVRTPATPSSAA